MAPGGTERPAAIAIAITGASGAIYATRTVAALLERGVHVDLIVSDYGRRLLRDELGDAASVDRFVPYLAERYGAGVNAGTISIHSNRDLGATIASGSHGCRGMAIVPCSMKTLAAVAHGLSRKPGRARRRRDAERTAPTRDRPERNADESAAAEEHGPLRRGRRDDPSGDAGVLPACRRRSMISPTSWPERSCRRSASTTNCTHRGPARPDRSWSLSRRREEPRRPRVHFLSNPIVVIFVSSR